MFGGFEKLIIYISEGLHRNNKFAAIVNMKFRLVEKFEPIYLFILNFNNHIKFQDGTHGRTFCCAIQEVAWHDYSIRVNIERSGP